MSAGVEWTLPGWNPRYVAYSRAHGRDPDAQLEHDKGAYPGGCMTGFMLWISRQRALFQVARPKAFFVGVDGRITGSIIDHEAWDWFLAASAATAEEAR